ncbi:hypothetical protein N7492_010373 [Penicillium capsulatum]|uniref:Carboxylic ester hydrolase n=1 Tax=Penicillium capsulatum TaxID=69766 RepID=A0A9W9LF25_9EURO|nr:hypothetical protein N7492_010373 [Penicillium capsulatum]KAJ6112877.1 hypothetical protein N7512_008201 [Penicillium capsulatum]
MSFQTPSSKVTLQIESLGRLDGFQYSNGVQQFCGIPYGTLSKRWTRAVLKTSWEDNYHDGTKLGNDCPRPKVSAGTTNPFLPVPPNPNFQQPRVDEKTALIINIVVPRQPHHHGEKCPVLAYIHGGSLLYGSSNYGIYDAVNLVSHSVTIGFPIAFVSFNYRLGLGGFLASSKIAEDLQRDGFEGNGNFGFTDQKLAMDWVVRYIGQFGGDAENITVVGQSAGGVSIGHHLAANDPMKFHRAVCMSGLGSTLRGLSLEYHEVLFAATCRYFSIDSQAPDVLDQLRKIPEQVLADADHIIQGVPSGTGNPYLDGWFYAHDPQAMTEAPSWLRSFILGDVHDEGVIFVANLTKDTYESVRCTIQEHVLDEKFVDTVLNEYGITANLSKDDLIEKVCALGADACFRIQNYETALLNKRLQSENTLFKYHFDQRSRLGNFLKGKAYHGFEIVYLFGNLDNELDEQERVMARDFASAWIKFTYGQEPWKTGTGLWKVWGPDCQQRVQTEEEDESVRNYTRLKKVFALGAGGMWKKYLTAIDSLLMKRGNLGKFSIEG